MNAYGPLFNTLALLAAVDPLAPKLAFCAVWFALGLFLVDLALRRGGITRTVWGVASLVFWNPFLWTNVAMNGQFDILVAALCICAIHLRLLQRDQVAGVALGFAVLLKYYPLLLMPFAAIDSGKVRLRMAASCIATVTVGLAFSWFIWGNSTFSPLLFAAGRESKMLSVFAFLRGRFSPLHVIFPSPNVDFLASAVLVVTLAAVFLGCYRRRVPILFSVLAGAVWSLTIYKVGHQQLLIVVFLLVAYLLAIGAMAASSQPLRWAITIYLAWLIAFDLAYCISGSSHRGFGLQHEPGLLLREFAGFPTFFLGGWVVCEILMQRLDNAHDEPVGTAGYAEGGPQKASYST